MKWRMSQDSLFAILLRSPWWISAAIGIGIGGAAYALLPAEYKVMGAFSSAPFIVIACIAAFRQLRAPSDNRIEKTLAAVRVMAWPEFAQVVEEGFRKDGFDVVRLNGGVADFKVTRQYRVALVCARKWKVARTGVEPLRELYAARDAQDAHECIYIAIGDVSDNAKKYAAEKHIGLMQGAELVRLLPSVGKGRRRAA
jgi:restriction system protein